MATSCAGYFNTGISVSGALTQCVDARLAAGAEERDQRRGGLERELVGRQHGARRGQREQDIRHRRLLARRGRGRHVGRGGRRGLRRIQQLPGACA